MARVAFGEGDRRAAAHVVLSAHSLPLPVLRAGDPYERELRETAAAVMAAAVVAKPDEKWGETPCAFIELKPGAQVTAEEIIQHCRAHLAHFKAPRAVVFGELPKTSTGKIQKFELRKQAGSATAINV